MQKHLGTDPELIKENSVGAHKHKKEGYQLFKDKYVKQVVVKANVVKDNNQVYYYVKIQERLLMLAVSATGLEIAACQWPKQAIFEKWQAKKNLNCQVKNIMAGEIL